MLQNYKKATLGGILLWVLIFVVWSIIIFLPPFKNGANLMWQFIIHYVMLVLFVWIVATMYLKKVKASAKEGLLYGIYLLVVGSILDAIITVPLFIDGDYLGYFGNWQMWIGYIEVLVFSTIFGMMFAETPPLEKKENENENHNGII